MSTERDGSRTKIKFTPQGGTAIEFEELGVTPPGFTSDDDVDNTHNRTGVIRDFEPGYRLTIGEGSASVKFAPADLPAILAARMEGKVGTLLVTYDSGNSNSYELMFIKNFEPDEVSGGTAPTATITFGCKGAAPTYIEGGSTSGS